MVRCVFVRTLLSFLAVALLAVAEVHPKRVFGPETAAGPYKHAACLTELDNGDLYLVYYGGGGEYAEATAVLGFCEDCRRSVSLARQRRHLAGAAWSGVERVTVLPLTVQVKRRLGPWPGSLG